MEMAYDLYTAHPFWAWAALAAAILAVEILTGSGWLLWAAASAGVVGLLALTGISFPAALLVYAGLTAASTLAARRYLPRSVVAEGDDINDNIARLVGQNGQAVAAFENRSGRVSIDGKEWAAELEAGERLKAGARVQVVGVHGARLRVREA
ncbi:NfeD family protein [Phenylobacterium sp. J367]|uniref:NfeD family protein n=1 Tax=Phenylobacterium sp. J367 TaxID=2898435 RepID=UPI00215105B9|nr:NfeD family protein [Phenylobacterium sp. J367]MCR5877435.1 NfeD family protein [Phenylobacterium sp. J367]